MANYEVLVSNDSVTGEYDICFISTSGYRFSTKVTQMELIEGKHRTLQNFIDAFVLDCLERIC